MGRVLHDQSGILIVFAGEKLDDAEVRFLPGAPTLQGDLGVESG